MRLTKFTKLLALVVTVATSAMFTGCSSDEHCRLIHSTALIRVHGGLIHQPIFVWII